MVTIVQWTNICTSTVSLYVALSVLKFYNFLSERKCNQLLGPWMYHTPNYCRLRQYTNVVAACRHSIVQNAHALLDVV